MKNTPQVINNGGLLDRRSFLLSGLSLSAALPLAALPLNSQAQALPSKSYERLPQWMKMPGSPVSEYGQPSPHEGHIKRHIAASTPQTSLFSVSHSPIQNQPGIITPNGLHFTVSHNGVPEIDPHQHELKIHGLVDKAIKFDLQSLLRLPMVSPIHFLECAGNSAPNAVSLTALNQSVDELSGQVSGIQYSGVPLKYLLQEAGLKNNAKWVIAEGADGGSHARSIPLSKLLDDAFIALYQNGERLRPEQGYPMRLFVPGWEGNTNVKWLHRLEISDQPAYTKDESGLYSDILANGDIRRFSFHMDVKSVITQPSGRMQLPNRKGYYDISGLAWSGHGKIKMVEVSVDEGKTWVKAHLQGPILSKALTRFSIPWQWDGKERVILSRAYDEHNRVQPSRSQWRSHYASYSFNHYNAIQAWSINADGLVENYYV